MLLSILQYTAQPPTTEKGPVPNVRSAEVVEDPVERQTHTLTAMMGSEVHYGLPDSLRAQRM